MGGEVAREFPSRLGYARIARTSTRATRARANARAQPGAPTRAAFQSGLTAAGSAAICRPASRSSANRILQAADRSPRRIGTQVPD